MHHALKKTISLLSCIVLPFSLAGCAHQQEMGVPGSFSSDRVTPKTTIGGAAIGATAGVIADGGTGLLVGGIAGGAVGAAVGLIEDSSGSVIKKLSKQNVEVVVLGDTVRIIIYTQTCFDDTSAVIQKSCYDRLNNVTGLISNYGNVKIHVTGYTDNALGNDQAKILSKQQAEAIAAYIWTRGIPYQRFVSIEGKGESDTIATNNTMVGSSSNRRVELNFWK